MIEMIFLLLLLRRKRGRRDAKEEERKSKSEKTFFFPTTHRHFDASGRLPADFHVEEHDWVGHDDDDFACAIVKEKMRKFDDDGTRFPFFLSKKRNEKVPTILQHHTKINATKAISLSISILFKEPMTSKEPLVY